jgi:hypothetical protein
MATTGENFTVVPDDDVRYSLSILHKHELTLVLGYGRSGLFSWRCMGDPLLIIM